MTVPRSRCRVLISMAAGVGLTLSSATVSARPVIVWNATASAPIGFYRVVPVDVAGLRIGDLVLARAPEDLAPVLAELGYLPLGVPLLKHVAATAGQTVCEHARIVSIDGQAVATALPFDSRSRALPHPEGCSVLGKGELLLLNANIPASLDGRYFGPTPAALVIGRAIPLWTERAL